MKPIEKYVEAMENKDFAGLAELFSKDGSLSDYCTNSSAQKEYHIYGKEAINMFFRNKFGFRQYSIMEAEVVNDTQAEFIANFGGYNIMAIATVREVNEEGQIKNLTVRPK
ncbi:MAG: nuclear transport factor 2 family protein [Lachnospiraceae bacterium]|nr:nuclear transport factor 2 family protein [Lachnospiraceae bacterium]